MNTFKIKTAELTGAALDWAVAQVVVMKVITDPNSPRHRQMVEDAEAVNGWYCYSPSTDWSQGGPLRDKFCVGIGTPDNWRTVSAICLLNRDGEIVRPHRAATGETALIALCRAIVAANLGDEVEVPQELVEVPHGD